MAAKRLQLGKRELMFKKLLIGFILITSLLSCGYAENPGYLATNSSLSEQEISDLLWMVEEEKLASDVYGELYDLWGLRPFYNIGARSEVQHVEAVNYLLATYGIENPSSSTRGEFSNPDLQALYDKLIAQGTQSLEQALYVGATIEEVDIVDLQNALAQTTQADIATVYKNLMMGSSNHLQAFMSQIEARGYSYTPQYLDEATFYAILDGTWN
ncbi:MAG: DUF2202 domain-containing protein [Trueperaceae bacterium]|nr:DUF2202 domain-containing protein [Trueperaceae bacterium]